MTDALAREMVTGLALYGSVGLLGIGTLVCLLADLLRMTIIRAAEGGG